jgi:hypothetical protein
MNRKINELLEGVRAELESGLEEESQAGNLGATNEPEIDDAMSKFIAGLVDALLERYEITEDDALMFITGMAEVFKDSGMLPPIPDENDPEVIKSEWLGAAQAGGFATEVMQAAEEIATD